MAYLLDTCVLIWSADPKDQFSEKAAKILEESSEPLFVSAASVAEIACIHARKRLTLPSHWKPWFRQMLEVNGWECLPVDLDTLEEAYSLPQPFHADPGDRIIVATARLRGLTLLTGDRKILAYPHVKTLW